MARQVLLVVLPGASGRLEVLRRLQSIAAGLGRELAVLVPAEDEARSAWARALCPDGYIAYSAGIDDHAEAELAVRGWLAAGGAVLSGILCYDQFGLLLTSLMCSAFGLPSSHPEVVRVLCDKHRFRLACERAGLPSLRHSVCSAEFVRGVTSDARDWPFPSVLKPRAGAGSWHVSIVAAASELSRAHEEVAGGLERSAFARCAREAGVVIEEFFDGLEVDVDGWCSHGQVRAPSPYRGRHVRPPRGRNASAV